MNMAQNGRIEIHLADLLEKSGLSKNKLCHRAEMQRTQINVNITVRQSRQSGVARATCPD